MSSQIDTTVRFSSLKPGAYTYGFTLTDEFFEEWKIDEIEGGNVKIDVKMDRREQMLLFTFTLSGEVRVLCDRCLGEMTLPVEGEEHLSVFFSDTDSTDDEEQAVLPTDATEIDLAHWMFEYVAIRIPLPHTHPDGACDPETVRYLTDESAPRPDDDIDPRWEALKKLK